MINTLYLSVEMIDYNDIILMSQFTHLPNQILQLIFTTSGELLRCVDDNFGDTVNAMVVYVMQNEEFKVDGILLGDTGQMPFSFTNSSNYF